jgi:hypothetical protein
MGYASAQACIDFIITVIIGNRRKIRCITVKCFGRQSKTVRIKSSGKFCCQVLGISRTAAVPCKIDTVTGLNAFTMTSTTAWVVPSIFHPVKVSALQKSMRRLFF